MKRNVIFLTVVAFVLVCRGAYAEDSTEKLEQLQDSVSELQQQVDELKTELSTTQTKLTDTETKVEKVEEEAGLIPDWVKNIANFTVDFRYRHLWIDDHNVSRKRNVNDLRTRLAVYGKVNDHIDLVFRVRANQPNMGTNFATVDVDADLAYVDYHPDSLTMLPFLGVGTEYVDGIAPFFELDTVEGIHILGGRFEDPLYHAGGSNLVVDDPYIEGAAALFKKKIKSCSIDAFGSFLASWVEERAAQSDTGLFAGQLGGIYHICDDYKINVKGALGYLYFANLEHKSSLGTDFEGNSSVTIGANNVYADQYRLLNLTGEINAEIEDIPVKLFGDYVNNVRNTVGGDDGFLLGAIVGRSAKLGDLRMAYNYREIQSDAIVGEFGSAEFGQGANTRGHLVDLGITLTKNCVGGIVGKFGDRDVNGKDADYYLVAGYFVAKF